MASGELRSNASEEGVVVFKSIIILVEFTDKSIRQLLLTDEQTEYVTDAVLSVASRNATRSVKVFDEDLSAGIEIKTRGDGEQQVKPRKVTNTVM